jgi:hypothetical protein
MSLIFATQLTAVATAVLAAFAIITAVVAASAFKKQSDAVTDGRELIGRRKDMLQVQAERLDVYRQQVDEQRPINAARAETLELQAREIRASLDQRERDAEEQRRSQAARVTAWFGRPSPDGPRGAIIRNASDLPVLNVRTFFNYIAEKWPGGDWDPVPRGAPGRSPSPSPRRSASTGCRKASEPAGRHACAT